MFLKELKLNHRKLGISYDNICPVLKQFTSSYSYEIWMCHSNKINMVLWLHILLFGMCCVFHILSSLKIKHWCDCCYRLPWPSQKSWHLSCRVPRSGGRHHRSYGICDQFNEHATPCWQSMHILGPDFEQEWFIFWKRNLINWNEIHRN